MKIKRHLIALISFFIGGVLVFSSLYQAIEGWSWLDSFYFVVITLTTVGYGDVVPQTSLGKVLTIFFSFFAIALFFYFVSLIGAYLIKKTKDK